MFLLFNKKLRKLFMADAGDGGSGGESGTEGSDSGTDGNPQDDGSKGGEGKTFTQDELDNIINDRLKREKKKYEGIDVAEYKKLKKAAEDKAEAEKTELEKAKNKLDLLEKEKENTLNLANKRLILAEFKVLAKEKGIKYVNDAYKLADLSTIEVKEDGSIEGLDEIVDGIIKEKPFLVDTQEESKGGTGKVDSKSKGDKGKETSSLGQRLAEQKKAQLDSKKESNYFK